MNVDESDLVNIEGRVTKFFDLPIGLRTIITQLLASGKASLTKKKHATI